MKRPGRNKTICSSILKPGAYHDHILPSLLLFSQALVPPPAKKGYGKLTRGSCSSTTRTEGGHRTLLPKSMRPRTILSLGERLLDTQTQHHMTSHAQYHYIICLQQIIIFIRSMSSNQECMMTLASFLGPHPTSRCLQYG